MVNNPGDRECPVQRADSDPVAVRRMHDVHWTSDYVAWRATDGGIAVWGPYGRLSRPGDAEIRPLYTGFVPARTSFSPALAAQTVPSAGSDRLHFFWVSPVSGELYHGWESYITRASYSCEPLVVQRYERLSFAHPQTSPTAVAVSAGAAGDSVYVFWSEAAASGKIFYTFSEAGEATLEDRPVRILSDEVDARWVLRPAAGAMRTSARISAAVFDRTWPYGHGSLAIHLWIVSDL